DNTSKIFSGIIQNGTATSVAYTKKGTGILTLLGANTYTGNTTINGGTIKLGASERIPNTSYLVVYGTFDLAGFSETTGKLDGPGTITSTEIGNLTLTVGDAVFNSQFTGIIQNGSATSLALTKYGGGMLTLSGANTYTGATTINGGTLSVNTLADVGTSSSIGTGSSVSAISMAASTTLIYTGTGHSTNRAITLTGNDITIDASGSGTLSFGGVINGSTFNLTLTGTGTGIESGMFSTSSVSVTKSGTGTWTLSGVRNYTGTTTVSAGILRATTSDVIANTDGPFGNNASGLYLNGGTIQTDVTIFNRPITITANGSGLDAYGSARTVNSPINLATAGTYNLNVGGVNTTGAAGQQLNLTNIISNTTGLLSVTKIGNSTVILSGANTYTGGTTIIAGTLQLGATGVLADAGILILSGGTFSTGSTIGFSETVSKIVLTANSNITLGTGNHILSFAASNDVGWTTNTMLTITGWSGGYDGTSGTVEKIFVGSLSTDITSVQLSQIQFNNGGTNYTATILPTGELVPACKPGITVQPLSVITCAGTGLASFTLTVTGTGLIFQWQEYISSWNDIANGGVYSGATSLTLTITNPSSGMTGYKYRCKVSNTCSPTAISDGNATLTLFINSFTTCGNTLTDCRDGQTYSTKLIDTQCWMSKNLNIGSKIDGALNQTNNNTIEKYCSDGVSNCATYGGLYQWAEAMQYKDNCDNYTLLQPTTPVQGICPTSWHIPTDEEWTTLTTYLSGNSSYWCNSNSTYIAKSMASTSGWGTDGTTCNVGNSQSTNNTSGFNALPAAYRVPSGSFINATYVNLLWSATQNNATSSWTRQLFYNLSTVTRSSTSKELGAEVRCVKN
ncbi:MAG: hypothetical protein HGB12_09630, partial [Bacteroidetes bacterium]|nr:hypothetical protein [Bacteroidota bacterium]